MIIVVVKDVAGVTEVVGGVLEEVVWGLRGL